MAASLNPTSTTDDVLAGHDLSGKRILVTGVSSGLGIETARALIAHGATVVGTVRDLAKAETVATPSREVAAAGNLELAELDLASLASVRACTDRLVESGRQFDAVIANAGVMAPPFGRTIDGFETQIGTNYFGHFVLVNRMASLLKAGARVVTLSSTAHRQANVDLADLNFERRPYDPHMAYGQSKTADALLAVAFDHRYKDRGIRATTVHPGMIYSGLGRNVGNAMLEGWIASVNAERAARGVAPFTPKSIEQGAATSVWATVVARAEDVGGKYCEDCNVSTKVFEGNQDDGVSGGYRPYALDLANALALWRKSEELVGESY